jgi:thiol:disulfide interchange protein/DsbC/DsbD-like thiol-disulfide interchange protein
MFLLLPPLASAATPAPGPLPPPIVASEAPASATKRGPDSAGKPHPVTARLFAETATVAPGGTLVLGIHLAQDEGWHTYWRAPGDVGQPTEAKWSVPAGVTVDALTFPLPERFEQDGQVSYGYDREVLLTAAVHVPADAKPGPLPVSVQVNWLVCKTSCIPGEAVLERTFPIAAGPATPGPNAATFAHHRARHPTPLAEVTEFTVAGKVSVSALRPEDRFRAAFVVTPTGPALGVGAGRTEGVLGVWPTFVPIPGGYDWSVTATEVTPLPDGRVAFLVDGETYAPDPLPASDRLGGLLQLEIGGRRVSTEVELPLAWAAKGAAVTTDPDPVFTAQAPPPTPPAPPATEQGAPPTTAVVAPVADVGSASLWLNLVFAFVGGLILNVMPCVLPVLTLKVYGLVEEAELSTRARRATGLAYTGGVVASFWAMALAVVVLRAAFGVEADWGFQFQYPPYVAALATIVFAFGLSMLGVFELPVVGGEKAGEAAAREGLLGVFFSGAFATLLATPCSAPFLGGAVAYAFAAPVPTLFLVFSMIGLGMSAPFLGVAFAPSLARFLPAPGPWMDVFKQLLGFSLLLTTVFLVHTLGSQIGQDRTSWFLVFLTVVGLGCWGFGRWGGLAETGSRQLGAAGAAGALIAGAAWAFVDLELDAEAACAPATVETAGLSFDEEIPWQAFSEPAIGALDGKLVFVDFTADWCLTCKVQERTVLETRTVRDAMQKHGVVPLKADWTRRDDVIKGWLNRHGRAGLPMYLVIPADRTRPTIVLPEAITPGMVVAALEQASSS